MTRISSQIASASNPTGTALVERLGAAIKAFARSFAARTAAELPERLRYDAGLSDNRLDCGASARVSREVEMEMLRRAF